VMLAARFGLRFEVYTALAGKRVAAQVEEPVEARAPIEIGFVRRAARADAQLVVARAGEEKGEEKGTFYFLGHWLITPRAGDTR
jgi:hypothetical protein